MACQLVEYDVRPLPLIAVGRYKYRGRFHLDSMELLYRLTLQLSCGRDSSMTPWTVIQAV